MNNAQKLRVLLLVATLPVVSAVTPKAARSQCCLVPDGETQAVSGASGGVTLFTVQVFDSYGTSFSGLDVEESLSSASNGCWYSGSTVPKTFSISGGLNEAIDDSNDYLDYIGLSNSTIHAMQLAGANGVSFPCSATWSQYVYIYCPDLGGFYPSPYIINSDGTTIEDKYDINNCRAGTCDGPFFYAP